MALLGTDRRDPPEPPEGLLADLIDDTIRESRSQRMLAAVSAGATARRAGFVADPATDRLAPPEPDPSAGVSGGGGRHLAVRRGRVAGARGRVGADRDRTWSAAATRRRGGAAHPAPHRRHAARPCGDRGGTRRPVGDRARPRVGPTHIRPRRRRRRDERAAARRATGARRRSWAPMRTRSRRRSARRSTPADSARPTGPCSSTCWRGAGPRCSTTPPRRSPRSIRCGRRPAWRWRSPTSPARAAGCWRSWRRRSSARGARSRAGRALGVELLDQLLRGDVAVALLDEVVEHLGVVSRRDRRPGSSPSPPCRARTRSARHR